MYAAAPVLSSLPCASKNSIRVDATRLPRRSTSAVAVKCAPMRRAQVVDTQVDRAELAEARHARLHRLVHVARADGGHHRQAAHRVERGADHAAVQALVAVVPDQLRPHLELAPLRASGRDAR